MVEKLEVMDTVTKFRKQETYTFNRTLAIFILCLFAVCLVAAGFLGYSVASCDPYEGLEDASTAGILLEDQTYRPKQLEPSTSTTEQLVTSTSTIRTSTISTSTVKPAKAEPQIDLRLPRSIVPYSYKLKLVPFLEEGNFTFSGEVQILVNVTESCKNITLHAEDLTIDSVLVFSDNNETIPILGTKLEKEVQFLIIQLGKSLQQHQQYFVHIKFTGTLNSLMEGFYRSSYIENNVTKWMALTQFQPTDARKAFPCFDEPAMKARFQISIARPLHMNTVSNMRKIAVSNAGPNLPNFEWDHYEESVPMSSYLVAFMVSEFQHVSNGSLSIWARSGAISQAKYALSIGPQILKYYEEFFGIKYPLPKLDMAAIPDFGAGAMENWGLLTYREPTLLYEDGVSGLAVKQRVAHIVAHELAHQWFGNLVTPYWWTDLWLNEGFATYVEYLGADNVGPEWKEPDTFVVDELHGALSLDTLKTSHQISIPIKNPLEIHEIFDTISYSKGASIIRMMESFLTKKVFHTGLNKYLNSKMYESATQDDLWSFLTEQGHVEHTLDKDMSVKEIMDTWTLQTGYPVIKATRNYELQSVELRQSRFLFDNKQTADDQLWWVPLTMTDKSGKITKTWLRKQRDITVTNLKAQSDDWLLVNVNQTGYYRVNYDLTNWQLIVGQLTTDGGHVKFDVKNRAQILDDIFNLAYSGQIAYDLALNVTKYLHQERDYLPWRAATDNLGFLQSMFERSAHFDKYKRFIIRLIEEYYRELEFKDIRDPLLARTQYDIVSTACRLGMRDCIIKAVQMFQNWKNSANPDAGNNIPRELRSIVYCTAVRDGGQEEWDFAWERYLKIDAGNEKELLLKSLGCTKEVWLLNRFLEWSITENSGIRKHDAPEVFASVVSNPIGYDLTYKFFKTNFDRIRIYVGTASPQFAMLISASINHFNTELEVNDFKQFMAPRKDKFGATQRAVQQILEQCDANIKWMTKYFPTVVQWFAKASI